MIRIKALSIEEKVIKIDTSNAGLYFVRLYSLSVIKKVIINNTKVMGTIIIAKTAPAGGWPVGYK
ncbi:MAG: hypothetical protein HN576_06640 [Bacteriovoracaceae bacterium]|nr:hypothetical protein [Bacteriovoracaceae bacterium]